jgi:hypothetical protein
MNTENPHPPRDTERHHGTCQHCGHPFSSAKSGRAFGSLACYLASDAFKANDAKRAAKTSAKRNEMECANCKQKFHIPPSKAKRRGHPCCSSACKREWFASRFDRHVATPANIQEVQQGYDEFLSQPELPCMVEGCRWSGKNLSAHMNMAHGVTADEFKARAGFNKQTGVICTSYARHLASVGVRHLPKHGRALPRRTKGKFQPRAEALEHYAKGQVLAADNRVRDEKGRWA